MTAMNTSARHILNVVVTYAVAVLVAVIIGSLFCLLSGCGTTFYNKDTGRPEAIFTGNMVRPSYTRSADGSMVWTADSVDHSTPTTAAGTAIQGNLGVVGTAVTAAKTIPAAIK